MPQAKLLSSGQGRASPILLRTTLAKMVGGRAELVAMEITAKCRALVVQGQATGPNEFTKSKAMRRAS